MTPREFGAQLPPLLLLLLLLTCAAAEASAKAAAHVDWSDSLEQSVRDLRAEIKARLTVDVKQQQRTAPPRSRQPVASDKRAEAASRSSDTRLLIENRAGSHLFLMHNGRAVDAQLGANRVYRVRHGFLFSEVCTTCGFRKCARHYKPAFYCLVASVCLIGVALVATLWAAVDACVRRKRAAKSAAAANSECHRPLLSESLESGLSVRCDPVILGGLRSMEKAII